MTRVNRICREKNKRRAFVPTDRSSRLVIARARRLTEYVRRKHARISTNHGSPSRQGTCDPDSWCEICQRQYSPSSKGFQSPLRFIISTHICFRLSLSCILIPLNSFLFCLSAYVSVSIRDRLTLHFCAVPKRLYSYLQSYRIHFFSCYSFFVRIFWSGLFFQALTFNLYKNHENRTRKYRGDDKTMRNRIRFSSAERALLFALVGYEIETTRLNPSGFVRIWTRPRVSRGFIRR